MKLNRSTQLLSGLGVLMLLVLMYILFFPNVKKFQDQKYFYVRTGYTLADVDRELIKQRIIKRPKLYRMSKVLMSFDSDDEVHPGRYRIGARTSNWSIISRIKNNREDKVEFDMSQVRTPVHFVELFYQNVESTQDELYRYFFSPQLYSRFDCDSMSLLAVFFHEKFEAKWSDDFRALLDSMHGDYQRFWADDTRTKLRQKMGLTAQEVMILTSIVQGEIRHDEEAKTVASVYLNRLRKGMKLQADPTVVYATGNFKTNRVRYRDTRVPSPFNTYIHKGLPPGPIQMVRQEIVDSVLRAHHTDYIFFCADPNNLGYHRFAETYAEHQKNAEDYQAYLDENNIH